MEMIVEKISLVAPLKISILDIYTVGQRVQQLVDTCNGSSYNCLSFLQSINGLLILMEKKQLQNKICYFTASVSKKNNSF